MKILFSHSYFLQFDPKQVQHAQPYAPLGTIVAAALVREHGFEVGLFDTMFSHRAEDILPTLKNFEPDVLVIYDDGFNYLTKMCLSNMRDAAFQMQGYAKAEGCKIIVASSDASDHYAKYLDKGADFVLLGEAEYTLLELLQHIQNKQTDFENIPGVAFYKDQAIFKSIKRVIKKDLDTFPLPAWDLVDIVPYKKVWLEKHGYFSVNIATTRGCPYKCNWCAKPIYGNIYNMRSPENVIAEIKLIGSLFSFDHVWFCDDIFGLRPDWVEKFAQLIQANNLHFKYKIQSRADLLVVDRYVDSLASSGCDEVWMGAESGSQKILDAMDKGTTVEQIKKARALLKTHGIKAAFFLQFGYLGETMEDIQKTIALVEDCMPDDIGISVSYPLPGTAFYEKVKHELGTKSNWTDSDELALMFKNTYPPAFYKTLHRLMHSIYRKRKALNKLKGPFPFSEKTKALGSYFKYTLKGRLQSYQLQKNKV